MNDLTKALLLRMACFAWMAVSLSASTASARADELILCGWDEVFVLGTNGAGGIDTNKIWSWKAMEIDGLPEHLRDKFRTTDECKPVEDGRKILVVSSGGGIALIERSTRKALFHAFIGNAHSAEILPNNRVVVAGSRHAQGNCLAVFNLHQPERIVYSEMLDSGHGVVWDEARHLLWALGYDQLKALRLKDWETGEPKLETLAAYALPGKSGHDLIPVLQSDDLLVTTGRNVFLFDRQQRTFRPHPALDSRREVKAVTIHPRTGQIVYIQAEGTNWWAGGVHMINPSGELRLPGERLYKARWNARRP